MKFRISAILFFLVVVLLGPAAMAQTNTQSDPDEVRTHSDSALVHSYLDEAAAIGGGDIRKQRKLLGMAHDVADSLNISSLIKIVEKDLGEYYLETSSYDSAQTVLEHAAERSSDIAVQTEVLNLLGTAYRYQSRYPEAMSTYNQALALSDSSENADISAAINTNKASIYERLGNRSKAISLYRKGIGFAEASLDSSFLATALNNLGNLYNAQLEYDEAQTYLEESIAISQKQEYYNTLLRATHNLANTQRDLGNFEEARELYREAWALQKKTRPDSPPIQLLFNMGMFHLEVSEFDEAVQHFRESLEFSEKAEIPDGLFHNYVGLGDVALAQENRSAATGYYHDAFEVANKVGSPPFRITASEKLYKVYKREGSFKQALKFHELAKQVSDSLTQVQQDEQLALAETELGLRQQQRINQLLEERQQQQEARIHTQNWLIGVSVLVIVLILISTYILYRSNKERKKANRELEELNEVKDKMMGIIAHDLRSPMASMQGIFYLLNDEEVSLDKIRELAAELEVSVQQNINMMDNLLGWANSQMSGLDIDIKHVSAHKIVKEVFDNCSLQADQKSITLSNKVDTNLEIKADANLFKLIVRNLVNNAIKFSNEGGTVTVEAEVDSGAVVLKVKDTGIGIPKEEQEQIFSVAGHSRSGTQNEKGSGLGLQLCKEFTEKQNGAIRLESTEGEGTIFYIHLPKGDN